MNLIGNEFYIIDKYLITVRYYLYSIIKFIWIIYQINKLIIKFCKKIDCIYLLNIYNNKIYTVEN